MKNVSVASVFPAPRAEVFLKLQQLETLQYIAKPYAEFEPVSTDEIKVWTPGSTGRYRLRLFGILPMGIHTIRIERFDPDEVSSKEGNPFVPVWNHRILMKEIDSTHTSYTDSVDIDAGWKTVFVAFWAKSFYRHRQRKWMELLAADGLTG